MSLSPSQRLANLDDLLLYRLGRLTAVAGVMVVRLCEGGYGVTRREWAVVAQLHGRGACLPSELAESMHRDRARTSRALSALLRKGLIVRVTVPKDRRSAQVSLTDAGRALYAELMPQVQAINSQILEALAPAESAQFDALLDRLQSRAQSLHGELSPALPKANRRLGRQAAGLA